MVIEKHICRKRKKNYKNRCHIDILILEDVDILVYDFLLTKKGSLRFMTTYIIKRLLEKERVAKWESTKPIHRSKNATTQMFGI